MKIKWWIKNKEGGYLVRLSTKIHIKKGEYMTENKKYWNNIYIDCKDKNTQYDLWLDKYKEILDNTKNQTILDLGCGAGGNTLYLKERGYSVLSVDNSCEALALVKNNISSSETKNLDITKNLPFEDESIQLIVADLSLHYFNDETTKKIIKELKRVLKAKSHLIVRVNSINDINYGAGEGEEIENHFYLGETGYKRFFDEEDIRSYFCEWDIKYLAEDIINKYGSDKTAFEALVKKR